MKVLILLALATLALSTTYSTTTGGEITIMFEATTAATTNDTSVVNSANAIAGDCTYWMTVTSNDTTYDATSPADVWSIALWLSDSADSGLAVTYTGTDGMDVTTSTDISYIVYTMVNGNAAAETDPSVEVTDAADCDTTCGSVATSTIFSASISTADSAAGSWVTEISLLSGFDATVEDLYDTTTDIYLWYTEEVAWSNSAISNFAAITADAEVSWVFDSTMEIDGLGVSSTGSSTTYSYEEIAMACDDGKLSSSRASQGIIAAAFALSFF